MWFNAISLWPTCNSHCSADSLGIKCNQTKKKKNVVKVQMQKWNTPVGVKHVLTRKALINT